ncbi:putative RNase H-like HicB family nuclease [Rhodoblastus acidophilus]|uniref:type II toxin-antitoxin system HicB family antitoxin n=1 Tax=Rhodoblastus acidophilus TaxID=1074 RepID=UPI002224C4A1|nr:type II toxin-antitoxin system HicB family antitoxin [Rhodoblastus acidophilus]MCW2317627.1 putative RNase H-like HicB family nuclease [Rhodoblastus acidophilus]
MLHYVGILDGANDVWGVRIADIDGCVGGGSTPEAALADAITALRDVVAHKKSGGHPVPSPSSVADVLARGEIGEGETAVMVPLVLDAGRNVRANLTIDAGLLEAIDEAAERSGITRSAYVASAAREKLMRA